MAKAHSAAPHLAQDCRRAMTVVRNQDSGSSASFHEIVTASQAVAKTFARLLKARGFWLSLLAAVKRLFNPDPTKVVGPLSTDLGRVWFFDRWVISERGDVYTVEPWVRNAARALSDPSEHYFYTFLLALQVGVVAFFLPLMHPSFTSLWSLVPGAIIFFGGPLSVPVRHFFFKRRLGRMVARGLHPVTSQGWLSAGRAMVRRVNDILDTPSGRHCRVEPPVVGAPSAS